MGRKGLGKGLDSLIPNIYDENFDSNSTQSLEEMLSDDVDIESENIPIDEEDNQVSNEVPLEETPEISKEEEIQQKHIDEVKKIVDKNPRITLWSSRSSAVFRYLRKTEPEFSISKEASLLIEEAVSKKYPEIWALFDDYE